MDNQKGKALLESKLGDLSVLYTAYIDSLEDDNVKEEELDRISFSTNKLQAEVEVLKGILESKKTEQKRGKAKTAKTISSPPPPPQKTKKPRRKSVKSPKFVVDSDDEVNSKLAEDLHLSSDDDEIQLHNDEKFEDDKKTSGVVKPQERTTPASSGQTELNSSLKASKERGSTQSAVVKTPELTHAFREQTEGNPSGKRSTSGKAVKEERSTQPALDAKSSQSSKPDSPPPPPAPEDYDQFIRQPLNQTEGSSDSDDSRLSRKRTRSLSWTSSKSLPSPRDTSPPPGEGTSKKGDPQPTFMVRTDSSGRWKTTAARRISNMPIKPDLFDIRSLTKYKLRMCSYYQWASCKFANRIYHDDLFESRWVHGCCWCYRNTNTVQPHPVKECPFIKLDFVQS